MGTKKVCSFAAAIAFTALLGCGDPRIAPSNTAFEPTSSEPSALAPVPPDKASGIGSSDELEIDWTAERNGMRVADSNDGRRYLQFDPPFQPTGLGSPVSVFVSKTPLSHVKTQLIFVYDSADYGRVLVIMGIDQLSAEQRHASNVQQVSYNDKPGVQGRAEIVAIRGGREALVGTSPSGRGTIVWRQGSIRVWVSGPSVSPQEAVEIAEKA